MCEALAVQSGSLGSCQVMKLLVLHSLRKPHLFCTTSVSHTAYIKMIAKRLCQHKSPCAPSACLQMHRGFAYPKSYRPSEALSLPLASRATKTLLSRRSFPGDVPQMSPPRDRPADWSQLHDPEQRAFQRTMHFGKVNTQPKYPSCGAAWPSSDP